MELLYEQPPDLDPDAIVRAVRGVMPIDVISASKSIIAVAHPDQITRFGHVARRGVNPAAWSVIRLSRLQLQQSLDHLLVRRLVELVHGLGAEVAATDCPLVVLLLEDGADQAQ